MLREVRFIQVLGEPPSQNAAVKYLKGKQRQEGY